MDKEHALRILNALANGVHPQPARSSADSPYQHPDTVRALFEAMRAIDGSAGGQAPAGGLAEARAPTERLRLALEHRGRTASRQRLRRRQDGGRACPYPQPQPRGDRGAPGEAGQDGSFRGHDAAALPAEAPGGQARQGRNGAMQPPMNADERRYDRS